MLISTEGDTSPASGVTSAGTAGTVSCAWAVGYEIGGEENLLKKGLLLPPHPPPLPRLFDLIESLLLVFSVD